MKVNNLAVVCSGWAAILIASCANRGDCALVIPNTYGAGADASLGNDSVIAGSFAGGAGNAIELRANDAATARNRLGIFRFDLSGASGPKSGATLSFYETGSNSRTVSVYGLIDGDAGESWDEATVAYDAAPGISLIPGASPATAFDPLRTISLGTFNTTASTAETVSFASPALDAFLEADTDGRATFYLYRDGGGGVVVRSKEFNYAGTSGAPPTLTLPTLPEPGAGILAGLASIGLLGVKRAKPNRE